MFNILLENNSLKNICTFPPELKLFAAKKDSRSDRTKPNMTRKIIYKNVVCSPMIYI